MKSDTRVAKRIVLPMALAILLAGCGGGGGSGGSDNPNPTPSGPFDTGTQAETVKSIALTALVETLYGFTGYLVEDSVAYHMHLSSSPSDPNGTVTVSQITCTSGSFSVVADPAANATFSSDGSVSYALSLDAAACKLPAVNSIAASETGGVVVSEQYDSSGKLNSYDYVFGPASTDASPDGTHVLSATADNQTINSSSNDTEITGTVSGSASSPTIVEQVSGTIQEAQTGVASPLGFNAIFTRTSQVASGQPTLIVGPSDPSTHFALYNDASWGSETCLTALSSSVLDIASAAQLQPSGDQLSPTGGQIQGTLVTASDDSEFTVSISFSPAGNATVTLTDSSSQQQTFTFDVDKLLASTSICGGVAGFWQAAGQHTALAKRIQGS